MASPLSLSTPGANALASAPQQRLPVHPQTEAALREFESILIGEFTNIMFSTIPTDGVTGGGHAESIYRSMMGQEVGREIAKRGGLGLMPALMNEVIRMQGGQP